MSAESPQPPPGGVFVPRWVIGAAAATLGLGLAGFAYLLGERSGREAARVEVARTEAISAEAAAGGSLPIEAPVETATVAAATDPAPDTATDAARANPLASDVRRYLDEFARIQDAGSAVSDPREFASVLLGQAQNGDMRGIDELVGKSERMGRELAALRPPAPCAEHHRLATGLATDATGLLRRLRGAIEQQDVLTLTSIATEGSTLEAKAKELARETDRLARAWAR